MPFPMCVPYRGFGGEVLIWIKAATRTPDDSTPCLITNCGKH